jgi:hypothetical protein
VPGSAPLDHYALVVSEATGISPSARVVLLCLIGLLLVILGFLIAFALLIRRRPAPAAVKEPAPRPRAAPARARERESREPELRPAPAGATVGESGALAVVRSESMACPTCRRQYEPLLEFCPRDARRLVPLSQLDARASGSICPACRRASEPGTRFCPHDGSELVPISLFEAMRSPDDADRAAGGPTGVMAKICPQCRSRHDLAATFCGRDGSELVSIN